MSKSNGILRATARSPWLWGGAVTVGFYWLVHEYQFGGPDVARYFAGHWVEYVTTAMFGVGMAVLAIKALEVLWQSRLSKRISLGEVPFGGQAVESAQELLATLARLPAGQQDSYLVRRLRDGLEHVRRNASAEKLEDELKYLSDMDAARQHASYALVRLILASTPLMGFLGTVIGITLAIAEISPKQLIESPQSVTAGLAVAFDTTALAIALAIALLVFQFLVDRFESQLLVAVDDRAIRELAGRFDTVSASADPMLSATRKMADTLVTATHRVVERQAELWQSTIDAAHQRWSHLGDVQEQLIETAFTRSLERCLTNFAQQLASAEHASAEKNRQHWLQVQQALVQATQAVQTQQAELTRQGEVLLQVVEATGQVMRLEESLNHNLAALAGAGNFEETLVSLSASVNLLAARMGAAEVDRHAISLKRSTVELGSASRTVEGQAA